MSGEALVDVRTGAAALGRACGLEGVRVGGLGQWDGSRDGTVQWERGGGARVWQAAQDSTRCLCLDDGPPEDLPCGTSKSGRCTRTFVVCGRPIFCVRL